MISVLSGIRNIKSGRKELRGSGLAIAALLIIAGGIALWRGNGNWLYFIISGSVFIGLGVFFPEILKPLHLLWMSIAIIIGFFMSRIILIILFFAVVTPIGLMTKILKMDLLDESIDRRKVSYWKQRDEGIKNKRTYENQF